jgi:hypothetical protein
MNEKNFKKYIYLFCENFNFPITEEYIKLVFKSLEHKKTTDEEFRRAVNNMILTKRKKDFYGRPAVADWLEILGKYQPNMTTEDSAKIKAHKVYTWLENNVFISDNFSFNPPKKYIDWTYIRVNFKFKDSSINYVINDKYGSLRALVERFGEQKIAGYGGAFKKELEDVFRLQGVYEPDKFVALEDNEETVKIDSIVKGLSNKLKGKK